MKIKKKLLAAAAAAAIGAASLLPAAALANPSCVLMKFTDDTRFDRIDSVGTLSDLVMEKLIASGKFNLKETKVIDQNMERLLYDERAQEYLNARRALERGDYGGLFEGPGFNGERASTLATAQLGQIVSPEITASLGRAHGADYLIQGTIMNIGRGAWMNPVATQVQVALALLPNLSNALFSALGNAFGPLGDLLGNFSMSEGVIGIQADLRLIKASSGEVVWRKQVVAKDSNKEYSIGFIKAGSDKIDSKIYYGSMEIAATAIVDALVLDADGGTLFDQ